MDWYKDFWTAWYENRVVQFQLLDGIKGRETFFKEFDGTLRIRALNIFATQGFLFNAKRSRFTSSPFHLYSSVAKLNWSSYPTIPQDKSQWKDYRLQFNKDFESLVFGYDFVLDIDSKDLHNAWEIADKVKNLFAEYGLPYSLIFSGSKGFHFRIGWNELRPHTSTIQETVILCKKLAMLIAEKTGYSFGAKEEIDSIYQLRRVIRVPYSIHPKSRLVALPLSDEQFDNFFKFDFSPWETMKHTFIKNRGLLTRQFKNNQLSKLISESNQKDYKA